jgi:hypothetical protein
VCSRRHRRFPSPHAREWIALANPLLLLVGFALLARQFEFSRIPAELPRGSIFLLALVLCASMMPVERLPAA